MKIIYFNLIISWSYIPESKSTYSAMVFCHMNNTPCLRQEHEKQSPDLPPSCLASCKIIFCDKIFKNKHFYDLKQQMHTVK